MDAIDAIRTRRSIRQYKRDAVPEELLATVLDCGRWAPSAGNRQPWRFIVVKNGDVKKRLASALPSGGFMTDAPLAIAVVIDPSASNHAVEDAAAATQNIMLAAHALGLGSCWIGAYNSPNEGAAKEVLEVPANFRIQSVIVVGYPAETPTRTRRSLDQIVYADKYGAK